MKIFIIGSDKSYAIERPYFSNLKALGIDVSLYPAQTYFFNYYYKSLFNKIKYRVGVSNILTVINKEILRKVRDFNPDFVWIFKGMEVFPETIQAIKGLGIITFNYNPDNPFIFSSKGSGNKNVIHSFKLYDLHLTYDLEVKTKIEKEYNIPASVLPFGYEVDEELYRKCVNQSEILKVCFLGNPDKERARFIIELANEGILMDIYGNNWNKFISHPNVIVHPPVYGEDLWKTLRRYRVQVNLMRIHNLNSHNMRSFEVPGVGGIMVAPKTIEHEMYFEDQKEVFLYESVKDCLEIIERLLSLSLTEANAIRQNARKRSVESGYAYKDRARQLLKELQNL